MNRTEDTRQKPRSKASKTASAVLTGDILDDGKLRRWFPLGLYCVALVFVFIGLHFNFQRLQRVEIQQRLELSQERSRAIVFQSMRMNASRHSRIIEEVRRRGLPLEESTVPPKKIETTNR